jgi:hypothetical protein
MCRRQLFRGGRGSRESVERRPIAGRGLVGGCKHLAHGGEPDLRVRPADGLREAGSEDLYEHVSVTFALDKAATVAHLEQIFDDLRSKIRPRDVFVFYAAGHGVTEDGR